jgi:hypothetical protein
VNSEKTYFELNQRKRKEITIEKDTIEVIIEDILYFSDDEDQQNIQKKKDLIGFQPRLLMMMMLAVIRQLFPSLFCTKLH